MLNLLIGSFGRTVYSLKEWALLFSKFVNFKTLKLFSGLKGLSFCVKDLKVLRTKFVLQAELFSEHKSVENKPILNPIDRRRNHSKRKTDLD